MILIDAGPLVAILDRDDSFHDRCAAALEAIPGSTFLTTWPAFAEAMYLLGRVKLSNGQSELWNAYDEGLVELTDLTSEEVSRTRELMDAYHDLPMDLADATIVAVAESRSLKTVFTFDSHFRVYRLADGSTLDVIP